MASATLTPAATTGTGIAFTASEDIFLAGDIDRQIIFGASRSVITVVTDAQHVTADIIDDFPNTSAIAVGSWFLRGPPGTTLDPDKKGPIGAVVTMTAGVATFRTNIVGKYIRLYDGVIKVTSRTSSSIIVGVLKSLMGEIAGTGVDPAAAAPGTWHIEVPSFSSVYGYPSAMEFHEGRLMLAGTDQQRTTVWGSATDSYENFARGSLASDAIEYTIASRKVNRIVWLAANGGTLAIGTAEDEFIMIGRGVDEPLGGDVIPLVKPQSSVGSKNIQPIVTSDALIFVQRVGRQIVAWDYNFDRDRFQPEDLTILSEHITENGVRQRPAAWQKQPDSRLFFVRNADFAPPEGVLVADGQLLAMTYMRIPENVTAWQRWRTYGTFENVAVIPHIDADRYSVYVSTRRLLGDGVTVKRFVEVFEDSDPNMGYRAWQGLNTDCATTATAAGPVSTISGLGRLEGLQVSVVIHSTELGLEQIAEVHMGLTVTSGVVTLPQAFEDDCAYEVGINYTSTIVSMRPTIPGAQIEGRFRRWVEPFARLYKSIGGTINGYVPKRTNGQNIPADALFTGDAKINDLGWTEDGKMTISQPYPYPFTISCAGGRAEFS